MRAYTLHGQVRTNAHHVIRYRVYRRRVPLLRFEVFSFFFFFFNDAVRCTRPANTGPPESLETIRVPTGYMINGRGRSVIYSIYRIPGTSYTRARAVCLCTAHIIKPYVYVTTTTTTFAQSVWPVCMGEGEGASLGRERTRRILTSGRDDFRRRLRGRRINAIYFRFVSHAA